MRMVLKQKCLILMYILCDIEDTYNVETLSDSSHQMCIVYNRDGVIYICVTISQRLPIVLGWDYIEFCLYKTLREFVTQNFDSSVL